MQVIKQIQNVECRIKNEKMRFLHELKRIKDNDITQFEELLEIKIIY